MRYWRFLFGMTVLCGCTAAAHDRTTAVLAPEPRDHAWWLRIEFKTTGTRIHGIPVADLDPSWVHGSELTHDDLPEEVLRAGGPDEMRDNGVVFSRSADFDNDGHMDTAMTGVYQDRSGSKGNFLLVLSAIDNQQWRKSFLKSWPGKPGFMAISRQGAGIDVWHCLYCDFGEHLDWDRETRMYIWQKNSVEE